MMITLYGISNCDTVRRARTWLNAHSIAYNYRDFRADGLAVETLRKWADIIGWEALLNRRSRSWKDLPESDRAALDEATALRLMISNPTLIKRPLVLKGDRIITGFNEDEFNVLFGITHTSATQGS